MLELANSQNDSTVVQLFLPELAVQNNVIQFPEQKSVEKKYKDWRGYNAKQGTDVQTADPIEDYGELLAMGKWLMDNADPEFFLAYALGVNVGLRVNELLSLTWADILNEDGSFKYVENISNRSDAIHVYQSKVKRGKVIFLNIGCIHALEWYMSKRGTKTYYSGSLFPGRFYRTNGKHISDTALRKQMQKAATACNVSCRVATHSLRKTAAVTLLKKGIVDKTSGMELIRIFLDHVSVKATKHYLRQKERLMKEFIHAINIDIVKDLDVCGTEKVVETVQSANDASEQMMALLNQILQENKELKARIDALTADSGTLAPQIV